MTTNRITPQIICDILSRGMSLGKDQVWVSNQRRSIPEDKRLYVVVGIAGLKAYGNNNKSMWVTGSTGPTGGTGQTGPTGTYQDQLSQYMLETISIDLLSYTQEALQRYNEVLGSLRSTYSQQIQELNGMKISEIPVSMNDVSFVEGAALIYRISITLPVFRKYDMILNADYYDDIEGFSIEEIEL
jgi:hypothetical protein